MKKAGCGLCPRGWGRERVMSWGALGPEGLRCNHKAHNRHLCWAHCPDGETGMGEGWASGVGKDLWVDPPLAQGPEPRLGKREVGGDGWL